MSLWQIQFTRSCLKLFRSHFKALYNDVDSRLQDMYTCIANVWGKYTNISWRTVLHTMDVDSSSDFLADTLFWLPNSAGSFCSSSVVLILISSSDKCRFFAVTCIHAVKFSGDAVNEFGAWYLTDDRLKLTQLLTPAHPYAGTGEVSTSQESRVDCGVGWFLRLNLHQFLINKGRQV